MKKLLENLYALIAFLALGIGLIVASLFLIAIIIGGNIGTTLAVIAGEIMKWSIILAAIAMFIGVIYIYFSRNHRLTIDQSDEDKVNS